MYGIWNCGFKKDELNIYFTAYDSFSCFSTDSPYSPVVSVHVCIVLKQSTWIVSSYLVTYIHIHVACYSTHTYIVYTHTYMLFAPHGTLCIPMHTFYSTHTVHIYFLFDPHGTLHIHYIHPHGTLINVCIYILTHLRTYE